MKPITLFIKTIFILFIINHTSYANTLEKNIRENAINKTYAKSFSKLIVQSKDGRMKPLDSLHLNILNKISEQTSFYGLTYNQVVLGMVFQPKLWKSVPMFKLKHPSLKKLLNTTHKKVSYNFLLNAQSQYKLESMALNAMSTEEQKRSAVEKAHITLYERFQIAKFIYNQGYMKIFPLKNTVNDTWYSPMTLKDNFYNELKRAAQTLFITNKENVYTSFNTNNWDRAILFVQHIQNFQKEYATHLIPDNTKIELEIIHNKILLFERLYTIYFILGLLLFIVTFIGLLKSKQFNKTYKLLASLIVVAFILHTMNLILRWYISNHAPWSDAYESMVFIAWTLILAGVYFMKHSNFTLPVTTLCASALLFSAHLSFIDPQITNLSPSLQSIWLTLHVALISASYGFLALSALLGIVVITTYTLISNNQFSLIFYKLSEITKVNELSMILGSFLLIIGTLLGSVWANEAWGRVWHWDPKESWSLIAIFVYIIILHLKLKGKFQNILHFSIIAFIAYGSILMTYFGVNYFFEAIHVYASNTNSEIPLWFYLLNLLFIIIIAMALFKDKKFTRSNL